MTIEHMQEANIGEKTYDDFYVDEKELETKFLLSPNINEDVDYRHLDKNLAITNLNSKLREPEIARSILSALHTLNNDKYTVYDKKTVLKDVRIEKRIIDRNGEDFEVEVEVPIYIEKLVEKNVFPKTFHKLKSRFYSLTTTSMARGGHLIKTIRTKNLRHERSIDERTQNKSPINFFSRKENNNYEREW